MLENTERSRETDNISQHKNTICIGHHYAQANTNHINKTWVLLQTTVCEDEPKIKHIVVMQGILECFDSKIIPFTGYEVFFHCLSWSCVIRWYIEKLIFTHLYMH